jgi:hypothetical protein
MDQDLAFFILFMIISKKPKWSQSANKGVFLPSRVSSLLLSGSPWPFTKSRIGIQKAVTRVGRRHMFSECVTGAVLQFDEVLGAGVGKFVVLAVAPDEFRGFNSGACASRYLVWMRPFCAATKSCTTRRRWVGCRPRSFPGMCRSRCSRNVTICGVRIAPGYSRKQKLHSVMPALTDSVCQLR